MFQDKEMVNDYLAGLNASLTGYANIIAQTNNAELRQTLIQLRNQDESRQRTLYSYALQKDTINLLHQLQKRSFSNCETN